LPAPRAGSNREMEQNNGEIYHFPFVLEMWIRFYVNRTRMLRERWVSSRTADKHQKQAKQNDILRRLCRISATLCCSQSHCAQIAQIHILSQITCRFTVCTSRKRENQSNEFQYSVLPNSSKSSAEVLRTMNGKAASFTVQGEITPERRRIEFRQARLSWASAAGRNQAIK
jgi:hypothetical protein